MALTPSPERESGIHNEQPTAEKLTEQVRNTLAQFGAEVQEVLDTTPAFGQQFPHIVEALVAAGHDVPNALPVDIDTLLELEAINTQL